jgi:D-glycero-D-manno-heptose 1,7-bisphosphate phosphatase
MKLVILGRDGMLNEFRENHVTAPEEWRARIPGALEAVARHQPCGLARGGGDQSVAASGAA